MTLNSSQFQELIENYCEYIVDQMDTDTMMRMCYDVLIDSYRKYNDEEIINEMCDLYDEEFASKMIESVGADPDTIL